MRSKKCPEGIDPKQYSEELHAEEECLAQANRQLVDSLDDEELRRRLGQICELEQLPKAEELSEIMRLYKSPVPIPVVYLDNESNKRIGDGPVVLHEVKKFCPKERGRMEELANEFLDYLPQGTKLEIMEVTDIACNKHYAITGIDADLAVAIERMVSVKKKVEAIRDKKQPPAPQKKPENKPHAYPDEHSHNEHKLKPADPCGPLTDAQATQVVVEKPQQAL